LCLAARCALAGRVELLRRKQQGQDLARLEYPLGATINGIAAGLHNTG